MAANQRSTFLRDFNGNEQSVRTLESHCTGEIKMKNIRKCALVSLLLTLPLAVFAQTQTYDLLTYTLPAGWQKAEVANAVQLSIEDKKTGGYAFITIRHSEAASVSSSENFRNVWEQVLKNTVTVTGEPKMETPAKSGDWEILSGSAPFSKNGTNGVAIQMTATGKGWLVGLFIFTNTQQFQNVLTEFVNSLQLAAAPAAPAQNTASSAAAPPGSPATAQSIVGLWQKYVLEHRAVSAAERENALYDNRFQEGNLGSALGSQRSAAERQLNTASMTAGYFRRDYTFKADGTYRFLEKDFSVLSARTIFFAYETGTWSISGNTLTITPKKGENQEWNKHPSGSTDGYGSLVKTMPRKLESVTYNTEMHYWAGQGTTSLFLRYDKPTEREGVPDTGQWHAWNYSPPDPYFNYSLIERDLPPGFKW
jgi:hypothetical protein